MKQKTSLHLLLTMVLLAGLISTAQAEEARIAVSVFQINSKEDLGYLQSGLSSLLPPRISVPGKIVVVDNNAVHRALSPPQADYSLEKKTQLTRTLEVDYLLTGSLTKFGDAISIDAFLYDAAKPENSTPLSVNCKGLDDLIAQVQVLAGNVQRRILYGTGPEPVMPSAPSIDHSPPVSGTFEAPRTEAPRSNPKPAAVLAPAPPVFNPEPYREYVIMGNPVRAMAMGDLTGKGHNSLLLADEFDVRVYDPTPEELILTATVPTKSAETIIQIDTFDLNNNGRNEIYVNSHTTEMANSFIAEYTDGAYVRIAENLQWLFHTYPDDNGSMMMVGMKPGTFNPFYGTSFKFIWKDGKPIAAGECSLPGGVSPFGSSRFDIDGEQPDEFIAFSRGIFGFEFQLIVLTSTGRILWKDPEGLGGEPNSFDRTLVGDNTVTAEPIPMRVYSGHINNDRRTDILVPRNTKKPGLLSALTTYSQGEMLCLSWDGVSLAHNWSSQILEGYIPDFLVTDIDGDGKLELLVVTVSFPGLSGKARNSIRVYKQAD